METAKINERVWAILGAVNMGLVVTDAGCVAIDTGLDKRAGKALANVAAELGKPLCAIINTHAHADHFGGNAFLVDKYPDLTIFAPAAEAAIIRRPQFEPEYLWQGAFPCSELRNKFLMADSSPVHNEIAMDGAFEIGGISFQSIPLPGHAHGQVGIHVQDVLFAADAYFATEVTDKHGIPFLVNLDLTLQSAADVLKVPAVAYIPGHGGISMDPSVDVRHLMDRHREAVEAVLEVARTGVTLDAGVQGLCQRFGLSPATPGAYVLIRTSVAAYLTSCLDGGIMEVHVSDGEMTFHTK